MAIKKGDFIKVEYLGKTDGHVFDTNIEAEAKKLGVDKKVEPLVVCVGFGDVIAGFDEALVGMKVSDSKTIVAPPEKAYGERRSELVKLVPLAVFKKSDIMPAPGLFVTLDGMPARIQSVSGGRVRVDFNHELAGRTLEFDIKIVGEVKDDKEKAKMVVDRVIPGCEVDVKDKKVVITAKKEIAKMPEYKPACDFLKKMIKERLGLEAEFKE